MTRPLRLMYIKNDTNDKVVEVEDQDMQRLESLKYLIRKLKLVK